MSNQISNKIPNKIIFKNFVELQQHLMEQNNPFDIQVELEENTNRIVFKTNLFYWSDESFHSAEEPEDAVVEEELEEEVCDEIREEFSICIVPDSIEEITSEQELLELVNNNVEV